MKKIKKYELNLCLENEDIYDIHTKFTQRKGIYKNIKPKILMYLLKCIVPLIVVCSIWIYIKLADSNKL